MQEVQEVQEVQQGGTASSTVLSRRCAWRQLERVEEVSIADERARVLMSAGKTLFIMQTQTVSSVVW